MSTTTADVASTSSAPPTVCGAVRYDIPVKPEDLACAMPYGKENADIMAKCCGDSNIVSYFNDCGIYCLVPNGQTNDDLTSCLYKNGAKEGLDVFCNANGTVTATATGQADIPATASASVLVTNEASNDDDDDDDDSDDKDDASKTGSDEKSTGKTSAGSSATSSSPAAPGLRPQSGVSLSGVVIGALLFSATAFGAFQI